MTIPRVVDGVALIVLCAFNALSEVFGGIGLLTPGSIGIPLSLLENSPFSTFLWPGLLLFVIVGGTQVMAVVTLWRRKGVALFWPTVAGFGLLIWIFVEVAFMDTWAIPVLYFSTALGQLALIAALLGVVPRMVAPAAGPFITVDAAAGVRRRAKAPISGA